MKKKLITLLIILATFSFIKFISASFYGNIGLIENSTWQQNLTKSQYANLAIFGDINNDGYLDLIETGVSEWSPTVADRTKVYINNGTSFEESWQWEWNLTGLTESSAALGDINNDGLLDLILSWPTRIYINNGTSFEENATWQNNVSNAAGSESLLIGDINNDGLLDLIFVAMYETDHLIYLNTGTTFINSSVWSSGVTNAGGKLSSVLADFDNDLDLDLNIIGYNSGKGYINNGTNFVYDSNWNTGAADEGSVVWGDIDNNGYIEAITSASSFLVFTNNGSLLWRNSTWSSEGAGLPYGCLALGDYDNNGFLDLVSVGGLERDIYLNNRTTFIEDWTAEENVTGTHYSSALWGDVDNNGLLDLLVIRNQKVYINNGTNPNHAPTSPISFSSSYNNRIIKLGWQNGSDNETLSMGLYYNLMVGTSTNNNSIISGVYGGYGDQDNGGTTGGYFGNMMQRKNFSLKVDRLQPSTTYRWYVQTIDTGLKAGNWSLVQSFTTPSDMERPNITLNAPVEAFNSSSYTITFNATVFDNMNLTNVSLWGNWTGTWKINQTNSSGINNTNYIFTVDLTGYLDGSYTWMIRAEDNATNSVNSSIRTFMLDTTKPQISIVYPANNTNSSNGNLNVNYTVSDTNLAYCWYSNDSMKVNITLADCGTNITTVTWYEGQHNVTIWVNDSFGNVNRSSVTFSIDTIKPNIQITYPSNNTNSSNSNLDVNYTVSDTNLASCWYSNDSYVKNTSLTNCGTNITTIIWTEGKHNVTIWVNDTYGNVNRSSIRFTIDTMAPFFTNLANQKVQDGSSLNYDINANDSGIGLGSFAINWTTNFSIVASTGVLTNISTLLVGIYYINVSVNDTLGNLNSSVIQINVTERDITPPAVTINSPTNTTYTESSYTININISENGTCLYSLDGGVSNSTLSTSNNLTFTGTKAGVSNANYVLYAYCNDTLGNQNNTEKVNFTISVPSSETPASSGGGGGGGGTTTTFWTSTKVLSNEVLNSGVEEELGVKERVQVEVGGEQHYVGVISVDNNSRRVTINISSNPIQITLGIGEERKVDVSNDDFYDIYLKLISILNNKANLTIKNIHEKILTSNVNGTVKGNETIINGEEVKKQGNLLWTALGVGAGVIVLFSVGIFIYLLNKKKKDKKLENRDKKDAKILKSEMRKLKRYKRWRIN